MIAVYEGYNAQPTAEGVGRATTRTVVISAVLTLDPGLHPDGHHALRSEPNMRPSRTIDLSTGLFVLLGFAAMLFLVTQITNREFSLSTAALIV